MCSKSRNCTCRTCNLPLREITAGFWVCDKCKVLSCKTGTLIIPITDLRFVETDTIFTNNQAVLHDLVQKEIDRQRLTEHEVYLNGICKEYWNARQIIEGYVKYNDDAVKLDYNSHIAKALYTLLIHAEKIKEYFSN